MLLVPILLEKFPEAMNLRLSRRFSSNTDVWNVNDMMEELRKELEARERCTVEKSGSSRTERSEPTSVEALLSRLKMEGFSDVNFSSLQALLVEQQPRKRQRDITCPFCNKGHYADQCRVVTEIAKRKELLTRGRRCYRCCMPNHVIRDCPSKKKCYKCKGDHHTSICDKRQDEDVPAEDQPAENVLATPAVSSRSKILLQTAQLDVRADLPGRSRATVNCKVLLDSCSQRTHITRSLAERIKAPIIRRDNVNINAFGGISLGPQSLEVAQLVLTKKGCNVHLRIEGLIVDKITKPLRGKYVQGSIQSFPHIRDKKLADDEQGDELQEVAILIGLEYYYDIVNGGPIKVQGAPTMVPSIFGYILSGDVNVPHDDRESDVYTTVTTLSTGHAISNEELYDSVKDFFNVQSSGITEEDEDEIKDEEFDIGIEKKDGRYYVSYPFKTDHPPIGDNYRSSLKRLHAMCRKMDKDSKLHRRYCDIMEDQERNGIIEEAPVECSDTTYTMPHHAVIREDRTTTKCRIVYDCSSKEDGASLNECMLTGTSKSTDLLSVFLRFRCHVIGMSADIKQAFFQIGVKEEFRDLTRFLWVKDPTDMKNIEPRSMRFARVIFGGVSSMAILDKVVRHHLDTCEDRFPVTIPLIRSSLYCDDFDGGAKDDETGYKVYSEVKEIFKEASMDMRKWVTNSPTLNERIREDGSSMDNLPVDDTPSAAAMQLNPTEIAPVKVLGTPWDIVTDELCITLDSLKDYPTGRVTKKILLSGATKPFDPLGINAPVILTLKILFQSVCTKSEGWDDQLPPKQQEIWDRFLEEAKEFKGIRVPRFYGNPTDGPVMLIGFGDASESAYAACVYIRFQRKEDGIGTALVAAKTRVAPVKKTTMPRLELLAALCLSKLTTKVIDTLMKLISIERVICLTDAEIVLNWIQREGREYKQYVRNRCNKIRKRIEVENWYHVPGKQNAADFPSRGCFPRQLEQPTTLHRWLFGMDWMFEEEEQWPIRKDVKPVFEDPELKDLKGNNEETRSDCLTVQHIPTPMIQKLIEIEEYSTLERLVRVVAWCRRFANNCRRKIEERKSGELVAEEFDEAMDISIRSAQGDLRKESGHEKRAQSLGLYEDEKGIERCRGRIGKAKIPFGARFPVILPRNHHFTVLIIREAHNKVYHNGVKETLAEVRSTYWIVKGRQIVKRLLKKCNLCKRLEGMAYPQPTTCDLPDFRVGGSRAFETVGVDFAGPVYVKDIYHPGSMNKAYIVINTCTSSRMVHLELTPDLTTAAYVRAHERFIARRGYPTLMISDNGRTFKGKDLKKFNARLGIKWRFNLSKAAWWGGMFERMVRSTKRCLKKAIGLRKLSFEEFTTILTNVEAVINNRPLTYVEEDDFDTVLTPSHLFCGRRTMDREISLGPMIAPKPKTNKLRDDVIYRTRQINASVDHFWKRWSKEYLVELRENHKMHTEKKALNIRPGDVVFIYEDGVKRNKWPMGIIQECIVGKDGVTRGATVRRLGEGGKPSLVNRPLQKLYPMEVTNDEVAHLYESDNNSDNNESEIGGESKIESELSVACDDDIDTTKDVADNKNVDIANDAASDTTTNEPLRQTRSKRTAGIAGEAQRRCNDSKN